MAASMTVKLEGNPFLDGKKDQAKIIIDWISHTDGVVSLGIKSTVNTAEAALGGTRLSLSKIKGKVTMIETVPGLNGDLTTALPTALYDLTLKDQYGYDLADGTLGDRSGTVAEAVAYSTPLAIDASELTVAIAAAGDTKKGRIIIHLDPVED